MNQLIQKVRSFIKNSKHLIAFTGAGISVESGIPPFRGTNGIWNKYDPLILDIDHYKKFPETIVEIRKMFYDVIENSEPNKAHFVLNEMERNGLLKMIITQNIDNLHFKAGNKNVIEFHGNTREVVCMKCGYKQSIADTDFSKRALLCPNCGALMKPNFVFFGEAIPTEAYRESFAEVQKADVVLIVGTSGLIMPASILPFKAKEFGAKLIEINVERSQYTDSVDIFLQGKASEIMSELV